MINPIKSTKNQLLFFVFSILRSYIRSWLKGKVVYSGADRGVNEGISPLAEPTKRSEVVSMIHTKWVLIDGSGSPQKGLGNVFPTSGQCALQLGHDWEYISPCLLILKTTDFIFSKHWICIATSVILHPLVSRFTGASPLIPRRAHRHLLGGG